jgi:DNA-directed RNA polymerase subunit omega
MTKLKDPNAGITSQDAVAAIGNRYDLVLIGARRVRELNRGDPAKIDPRYGNLVTAQIEIEQGLVGRDYLKKDTNVTSRRRKF